MKLTVIKRGDRYYPEADGQPFYYTVPRSNVHHVVSYGSYHQASNLLWSDYRTYIYADMTDSHEPFKVAAVFAEAYTNLERIQAEAKITDPLVSGYNSDDEIIVPGTHSTYREMILAGFDPNGEEHAEAFRNSLGLA